MVLGDEVIEFQFIVKIEFIHNVLFMAYGGFIGDANLFSNILHIEAGVKTVGDLFLG